MASKQTDKIGDVAAELGTTPRTLRFYEDQGLVTPGRSALGTRHYSDENKARIRAALQLSALGIPLSDLHSLVQIRPDSETGQQASHQVDALLTRFQEKLSDERARLDSQLHQLQQARQLVQQCFHCEQPPTRHTCLACPVGLHRENVPLLNLVWEEEQHA